MSLAAHRVAVNVTPVVFLSAREPPRSTGLLQMQRTPSFNRVRSFGAPRHFHKNWNDKI